MFEFKAGWGIRIVTASLLTFTFEAHAAVLEWKDAHAPSRANTLSLAGAGNVLWAGTGSGYVYRSEDGGMNWARSGLPAGFPVVSLRAYGDSLFAIRSRFLPISSDCFSDWCRTPYHPDMAVSKDQGRSWSVVDAHGATALTRQSDGSLWAFSHDSVFRSAPGAEEWAGRPFRLPAIANNQPHNIRDAVALPELLYAIIDGYLYQASTSPLADTLGFTGAGSFPAHGLYPIDRGWLLVSLTPGLASISGGGPPKMLLNDSMMGCCIPKLGWLGPAERGMLGLSRDSLIVYHNFGQGYTWGQAAPILPEPAHAAAEAGGRLAVAIASGEILISDKGGAWKRPEAGPSETAVSPFGVGDGQVWALAADSGIVHAPVAGGEWAREELPIGARASRQWLAATPDALWIGNEAGLRTRKSGTGSWTVVLADPVTALASNGRGVVAAVERGLPDSPGHILAFCEGKGPCRETPQGLFGRTQVVHSPLTGDKSAYFRMGFLAVRGDTLVAADSLLYRSRDGGNTWDTVPDAGGANPAALATSLASARGGLYRTVFPAGCDPCLERSADLGSTWTRLPFDGPLQSPARAQLASDGDGLFLLTDKGLLWSGDGGHWSEIWRGGNPPLAMALGMGYASVSDAGNRLWVAQLPQSPIGIFRKGRPGREKAPGAPRFPDRRGRPRLANGSAARP
jgi:photosystem II stability/assembly factor-like uncharacterized protein